LSLYSSPQLKKIGAETEGASWDARCPEVTRAGGKFQISSNFSERFGVTKDCSAGFPRAPQTHLVFHFWRSFFITLLAIALRSAGIYRPVPYLTYSGSYLMHAFFQRFLEWIPWKYADNLISELLLFFVLNVLGYAFVIFLLLRIFFLIVRANCLP
jgi:hypothetical protein